MRELKTTRNSKNFVVFNLCYFSYSAIYSTLYFAISNEKKIFFQKKFFLFYKVFIYTYKCKDIL